MNHTSVLAMCLDRLSWSPDRLAREINRVCGAGTISAKAPYNWLKGSCPRRGLPRVVSEILAERLGEPVPVHSLWPGKFPPMAPESGQDRLPGTPPAPCHPGYAVPASRPHLAPPITATGDQDLITTAVDWLLNTDSRPAAQLRGEEVDATALGMISERISQFRRLDDDRGGRLLLDWAVHDLRWARTLIDTCSYDQETGVRLHGLVAELGQIVGWVAADLGDEPHGRLYLLDALRSARSAGDRALAAHIISCLSYQAAWHGRGEEALRLIQIARKGTADQPPSRGQALLASRQARAHASLGDPVGCRRALEETADISEAIGDTQWTAEPQGREPWAYWVTPAVLVGDAGRAWLEVGRPGRAALDLARGLELFDGSQPRNRLLHQSSLAEARLSLGEVDGAAQAAGAALDLAGQVASARGRARLAGLRRQFQHQDAAEARQIVQRTDHVLGRTRN
ncbi:hypothetical protein [Streptantibioticus ferralitis]|uniref:Transcriptional regulator n=1 Tax=Streptantibioticus ferralitis TaxID=236510 RepID=A0ABT5ZBR6_9ACTN|nr:hypothetical protein [Streptantibioticus ferralitis]MDF2261280.1 hypothetical protein [Streptantibioticus ferralitis]